MKINSRAKGARVERLFRDLLKEHGLNARRGQQFSGSPDSPDVVCDELKNYAHFEVKGVKIAQVPAWLRQAKRDANAGTVPVVAWKLDRQDFVCIIDAHDFVELLKRVVKNEQEEDGARGVPLS